MSEYIAPAQKAEIAAASGFKVASDEDVRLNQDCYKEYKSARAPRYGDQVECENFYHNVMFSPEQRSEIIARGQAPLEINITYSIIKQMISLLTSEDPTWDVDPVGDSNKDYAYIMRDLLSASWYNSRAGRQFSQVAKNTLISGVGYATVNPSMRGAFGVQFKHTPYHHVYPSPNIREFSGEDAENWVISKQMSQRQTSELLGISLKEVEKIAQESAETGGADSAEKAEPSVRYMSPIEGHKQIRVIQRLTMENTKMYLVKPKEAGIIGRKVYFHLTDALKSQQQEGLIEIQEQEARVMAKYISVGGYGHKYYLPITTYNIIPFIDEFNDNPYPMGEVDFLMPLQKALNKFIMLSLLNATLSNNMKMIAPKGSIDKSSYESGYSLPGALVEYEWEQGKPEPKQINPVPFSGAFFEFPKMLISLMEYLTGIFGVVQGNPEGAPRTASGLMSLQNYGGQKVRLLGRNMNDALSAAGDVAIELFQNYAPYNGIISYFDAQEAEVKQVRYNTLTSKDGGNLTIDNDLSVGKFRTRCMVRQNYGSERELKANMLANLAAQIGAGGTALLKPILKLADIPEADEVMQAVDEVQKANQTIAQQQEQLQRLTQINEQLENQVMKKSQQAELASFEVQLSKMMADLKSQLGTSLIQEIEKMRTDLALQNSPTEQPTT